MTRGVEDQVWMITGASGGFGRAIARDVRARGGRVVATARNGAAVADLEAEDPTQVLALPLDITKPDQIAAAVGAAEARFGHIDVLLNNAGYGFLSGVEEAAEAEYREQFEVNFFGTVALTRAVLPTMRRRRSGFIVNISSVVGVYGVAGAGFYAASKFALEGFSEALGDELKPFGVGVLIVEPGPFRTAFFGGSMKVPANPMPDYAHTAAMRENSARASGRQTGDPERAAAAIVDTVAGPTPPTRIVLGGDAFERACAALERRLADIGRSREQARAADFPVSPGPA